jgi:hypothetical protein
LKGFAQCKDDRSLENCSSRASLTNKAASKNVLICALEVNKVIPVVLTYERRLNLRRDGFVDCVL